MSETWLAPQAYARLQEELTHLQGPARAGIVARIAAARAEGDLRENGGYHAAREEQAKMEGRIAQLKALLENATVGEPPADGGVVAPGMVVTATVAGRTMTFLLGSRETAGSTDIEVYSERSPLGAAILGACPGETRSYTAPNGKQIDVVVTDATPFTG